MDLSQKENINCPLCESDSYKKKYTVKGWAVVKCNNCSFVYVNPRLTHQELNNIYQSNYFDNTDFGYLDYTENKELRKKNFAKWVDDALPFLSKKSNINALDIGCATGYCLEIFDEKGWKHYGIELDTKIAENLNKNGFSVSHSTLLETTFSNKFSVITLFDVIEHLTELQSNFQKLYNSLEEDGIIIIITPNYQSLQRKILGEKWFQFKPIEHINYFTLGTLQKLISTTGFKIIYHKNAGQYADMEFLKNRLAKYKFPFFIPLLHCLAVLFNFRKKYLYTDTASLYLVLKKASVDRQTN